MEKIVMFHYFYDNKKYKKVQGAISAQELEELILSKKYKVISAELLLTKYKDKKLEKNEICFSFDDGLKEQKEIALPILEKYKLKAIFNINTYPTINEIDKLEIYRYYRNYYFGNVEEFYKTFFSYLEENFQDYKKNSELNDFSQYLIKSKFYSYNDRKFRYFRDVILKEKYYEIMDELIKKIQNLQEVKDKIWLKKEEIKNLSDLGHLIGLHTHTHPTNLDELTFSEQLEEFEQNKNILEEIIEKKIELVAYPCGKYNKDTFRCMNKLGIKFGLSATTKENNYHNLLISREDISDILDEIKVEIK